MNKLTAFLAKHFITQLLQDSYRDRSEKKVLQFLFKTILTNQQSEFREDNEITTVDYILEQIRFIISLAIIISVVDMLMLKLMVLMTAKIMMKMLMTGQTLLKSKWSLANLMVALPIVPKLVTG
jgi:hypothetical protein